MSLETPAQVRYEMIWENVWQWCDCIECRLRRSTTIVRELLATPEAQKAKPRTLSDELTIFRSIFQAWLFGGPPPTS